MNEDQAKPRIAEETGKDPQPQPVTVAQSDEPAPERDELEPASATVPAIDKPAEKEDPPVVTDPTGGDGDDGGNDERANDDRANDERATVTKPTESTDKPKAAAKKVEPVTVILFIKGYHGPGTIKFGKKEYPVQAGMVKIPKVAPASYDVKWRTGDTDSWQEAGKVTVGPISPDYYQFHLGKGTFNETITKGKTK